MPEILFASNNTSHFPTTTRSVDTNQFDSTNVPYGLELAAALGSLAPSPKFKPSSSGECFIKFDYYATRLPYSNAITSQPVSFYDVNSNLLGKLTYTNNSGWGVSVEDGSSAVSDVGNVLEGFNLLSHMTIKFEVTAFKIKMTLLINSATVAVAEILGNANSYGNVASFVLQRGPATGSNIFSGFIVSDYDLGQAKGNFRVLAAAGAYSDWSGTLSSLGDSDLLTGVSTIAADAMHSGVPSVYTGTEIISHVCVVSSTVRGQNSPTQLAHFVRSSTIDYLGAAAAIPFVNDYQLTDFPQNPATSAPWASGDMGFEVGFKSIA